MIYRAASVGLFIAAAIAGCGNGSEPPRPEGGGEGPAHIHGLGVNPRDGALFVATHTGLFRAGPHERRGRRVADRWQDTMGFTVVGPDRFLGSGHPDLQDRLPPLLGLISTNDAGRTWRPVSLMGRADFHILRAASRRIYGFDATSGALMVSSDSGRSWARHRPPRPLVDLVVDPRDAEHVVASGERDIFESRDAGRSWRRLIAGGATLLAWTDALVILNDDGVVYRSRDGGRSLTRAGEVGGPPAALAVDGSDLYVARHDNSVQVSSDGGRTWRQRLAP